MTFTVLYCESKACCIIISETLSAIISVCYNVKYFLKIKVFIFRAANMHSNKAKTLYIRINIITQPFHIWVWHLDCWHFTGFLNWFYTNSVLKKLVMFPPYQKCHWLNTTFKYIVLDLIVENSVRKKSESVRKTNNHMSSCNNNIT